MWKTTILAVLAVALLTTPATAQQEVSVPDSVARHIKAQAASEWPDDYAMQKYVIEQETEAYDWVRRSPLILEGGYISAKTVVGIRKKARAEWPRQYAMQKYVIEQQVEAYLALQE